MSAPADRLPFLSHLLADGAFSTLCSRSPGTGTPLHLRGMAGSLPGLFAAMYYRQKKTQTVLIAADAESAEALWNDASLLLPESELLYIGERPSATHHSLRHDEHAFAENADALRAITEHPDCLVVTDAETLLDSFPSIQDIREQSVTLRRGEAYGQQNLVRSLAFGALEQVEFVASTGEYAVRGGLVDVFPVGFDNPVRVEFFGDEIDSIREFDALSQRSIRRYESIAFVASLFLHEDGEERPRSAMQEFFSDSATIIVNGAERVRSVLRELGNEQPLDDLLRARPSFVMQVVEDAGAERVVVPAEAQPAFNSSIRFLRDHLEDMEEKGYRVFLLADSEQQAERMQDLLQDSGATGEDDDGRLPWSGTVTYSPLSSGFILHDRKLAVYTEHQVFGRQQVRKRARKGHRGISLREMRQLRIGDYVVHADKGIGRFTGFETITVHGGKQETARLQYAGDDTLYVNLNYIGKLQKYSSEEGTAPALSKLGSGAWDRIKAKTKKRLKDIARDLIQLYAKRKMSDGYAFSPDSQWQKELEASFIYEDTPDQRDATVAVKNDMQEAVPMDRLVCGDVGYGKTEVAVRAAFKAVLDGKQVAVLVPTTILAQQHYHTFSDRLHRYSVVVEALSRFRTRKEQAEIVEKLTRGSIDIIIGTHRMLSKDVGFKDLGLLIIDEEHRFGVTAKERLRQLRANVDTLTLTATPIPRTLNFSLLGARDLSVIETPPKNRLPIITSILPFEEDVVIEGVRRELQRGGQVFFVNDRVADLELLADKLRVWLPGTRIAVAHGQMPSTELERVMMRFLEKKVDVLVATKIVESGLDIPNANTIFINRAQNFGLAELYQLRGRVGRSNTQAYAYLLVPSEAKMTRDALKRLQAIEEFSELGTGFQLAMRDLEIRGAGNLMGAEQSGFIAEIGFELFMATLEEAVQELKQEEFEGLFEEDIRRQELPRSDVVVELGEDAYFPQDYVRNSTERFDLYRRLYNCINDEEIDDIEQELLDRFGQLPPQGRQLFFAVRTRLIAARIRLARVTLQEGHCNIALPPEDDAVFYDRHFQPLMTWVLSNKGRMQLEQDSRQVRLIIRSVNSPEETHAILAEMLGIVTPQEAA